VDGAELRRCFYPESAVGGFSHVDGTVAFFTQISSVLKPTDVVLDFGAGRGEHIVDDAIAYRRDLSTLKGRCAHVEGCDLDDAVLHNDYLDHATVLTANAPLPFPDDEFDVIVSRYVFEHVDNPQFIANELLRVVKPGGWIAAVTPNKYGYIAAGARLIPNRMHVNALKNIQPTRKAQDVFPTQYRMNTAVTLRRLFGSRADVAVSYWSSEPAYHFGSPVIFRAMKWTHKHFPDVVQPVLHVYIRKR
jgi:SAM-dependent methyltransferase